MSILTFPIPFCQKVVTLAGTHFLLADMVSACFDDSDISEPAGQDSQKVAYRTFYGSGGLF